MVYIILFLKKCYKIEKSTCNGIIECGKIGLRNEKGGGNMSEALAIEILNKLDKVIDKQEEMK